MRYYLFISHGELASGMTGALRMLVGDRDDVLHAAFKDGMGLPAFKEDIRRVLQPITGEDEVIVLADLISGSPLATAMEILAEKLELSAVRAVGGMNLPMAVTAVECEDDPLDETVSAMLECAAEQIKLFNTDVTDSGDGDDI